MTNTTKMQVDFNGEVISLRELSRRVGLSYDCLRERWYNGERGADLVRPSRRGMTAARAPRAHAETMPPVIVRPINDGVVSVARRERYRCALERARKDLEAELSRPLIDIRLVTPAERQEIQARVRGTHRWSNETEA